MTYVEGIGDELLLIFVALLFVAIVTIAWLSTSVREPRISVIVVDRARFQQILQRVRNAGFNITRLQNRLQNGDQSNTNQQNENQTVINEGSSSESNDANVEATNSRAEETRQDNNSAAPETLESKPLHDKNQKVENLSPSESREAVSDKSNATDANIAEVNNRDSVVSENINTQKGEPSEENCNSKDGSVPSSISSTQVFRNTIKSSLFTTDIDNGSSVDQCDNSDHSEIQDVAQRQRDSVQSSQHKHSESQKEPVAEATGSNDQTKNGAKLPQSQGIETEDILQDGHIRVKLKYLDERQRMVQVRPQLTIGEFKRSHFAGEIAENYLVRLIYNGQELRQDTQSLQAYNIQDKCVIHCLLSRNTQNSNSRNETRIVEDEEDLNLGTYIFPLFGVILGLIWYSRFAYGKYFNAISTLSLFGITFLYVVVLLSSLRYRNENNIVEVHEHQD